MSETSQEAAEPQTSIATYVCTYKRNEPLRRTLDSLAAAARRVQPRVGIAVVVVDDNPDGRAKEVVEGYEGPFALGLHYVHSGSENISIARNLGLEAAMPLADWVAMTDDDLEVVEDWFAAMLEVQRDSDADAVTGPVVVRYHEEAARWLTDQPFLDVLVAENHPNGAEVGVCSTGNSMIRSAFLRAHPEIRFRPDLGKLGGEDMVFYRAAVAAGLRARFATAAVCETEQSRDREHYRYQLHSCYWLGNSEFLTNHESGQATRARLAVRGVRRLAEAIARPFTRMAQGKKPQWRYGGALVARSAGILVGVMGIKVAHP